MLILVTGSNGQLGKSIKSLVEENLLQHTFTFITKNELNFLDIKNIHNYFKTHNYDLIINCAAYTQVDKAESDEKKANLINNLALEVISNIAIKKNIKLIHISTDFVFNGLKQQKYTESDTPSPLNIYGKTKLAGENVILKIMRKNAIILRTSWVYSEYGNNFVETIINLAKENTHLNIVSDQIGSPTYANDLAKTILKIINDENFNDIDFSSKVFNYSTSGGCSWYDFAKEIIKVSKINCKIEPIKTQDYPLPAKRPKFSILSKKKIKKEYDLEIKHWKDSLKICLENLEN